MITRSLTATFKHIWTRDWAIDQKHEKYNPDAYLLTGDAQHLPLNEGQRPAVYECAPLSRRQFQVVLQMKLQERPIDACVLAVSYGLRGITGFYDANGAEIAVQFHTDANGDKMVAAATLDTLYDMNLLAQLGTRIINESTLRPKNAQE